MSRAFVSRTRDQLKAKVAAAAAEYAKALEGPRVEEKRAAAAAAAASKARYQKMITGYREEEKRQAASDHFPWGERN